MFFSPQQDRLPIAVRVMGLIKQNPTMLKTFVRTAYRNRIGAKLDQRFHNGHAAPPVRLLINLTRQCNLRCRMCIQGAKSEGKDLYPWNDPKNQIGIADWVKLMDQTAGFFPFLSVSGGEPTIYPQFKEFVIEAKKRKFVFELVTNATLLSHYADFIVEQGIEFVSVSLDGLEEQHDDIRGHPGTFRRAVEGLKALVEARKRARSYSPVITVGFVVMKSNIEIMDQMAPLALDLGVDTLLYQHLIFDSPENVAKHNKIMNADWAREKGIDIVQPSMPDGEYFLSDIDQVDVAAIRAGIAKAKAIAGKRMFVGDSPHLSSDMLEPYYLDLNHPLKGICKCLWSRAKILPDGTMIPCLHVVGGNITKNTFMEVWNSQQMMRFREVLKKRFFPACVRCCCMEF